MSLNVSRKNPGGFYTDAAGKIHTYRGTRPPVHTTPASMQTRHVATVQGAATPTPIAPPPPPAAPRAPLDEALALANKVEAAQLAKSIIDDHARRERATEDLAELERLAGVNDADAMTIDDLLATERELNEHHAAVERERAAKRTTPDPLQDVVDYVNARANGGAT